MPLIGTKKKLTPPPINETLGPLIGSTLGMQQTDQMANTWQAPTMIGVALPSSLNPTEVASPQATAMQGVTVHALPSSLNPTEVASPQAIQPTYNPGAAAVTPQQGIVNDMMSGQAFDPYRQRAQEAQARFERDTRASGAAIANQRGFAGQGIGDQMANTTEAGLARQRFDTGIALDIGEQATKERGAGIAMAEAWKTLDWAAVNGSDADFVSAYEKATGQKIDPMAVSQYRGYARTLAEQQIAAGARAATEATSGDFANYVSTHTNLKDLDEAGIANAMASDPAFKSKAQAMWEGSGGTGPVSASWVAGQVAAINDPKLNNALVALSTQFSDAVKAGVMTQDDANIAMAFITQGLTGKSDFDIVKDPATGEITFTKKTEKKGSGTTPEKPYSDQEWGAMGEAEKWTAYEESIPSSEKEKPDYDSSSYQAAWKDAGMPQTWDAGGSKAPEKYPTVPATNPDGTPNPKFEELKKDAMPYDLRGGENTGHGHESIIKFNAPPQDGEVFLFMGTLYQKLPSGTGSGMLRQVITGDDDIEYFYAKNVSTGQRVKIRMKQNGEPSVEPA